MKIYTTIKFDELPLIRELHTTAGYVSGQAEISIWDADDWSVDDISLDGHAENGRPALVEICRDSWLFRAIHSELEARYRNKIDDAISSALEDA